VLSGFQRPTSGFVQVRGQDATKWGPERVVRAGVSRTFQAVRPFAKLTVAENLELGALGVGASRKVARERVATIISALNLGHRADTRADKLPHGEERRLGIGRALATSPAVLLLDEPAAGANESESEELVHALRILKADFECSLVIIEHDMQLIMSICERIHVLDYGKSIAEGTPEHIRKNPAVLEAYLGRRTVGDDA
jgi:branched-chain amino acid transport system ATP-binding protein